MSIVKGIWFCFKSKTIDKLKASDTDKQKIKLIKKMQKEKNREKQAIKFFRDQTKHIEIVREDTIEKIYFILLPFCRTLPKKDKRKFQEEVPRSN
jgi:hypothetical protein